jgi:hypothetical protein
LTTDVLAKPEALKARDRCRSRVFVGLECGDPGSRFEIVNPTHRGDGPMITKLKTAQQETAAAARVSRALEAAQAMRDHEVRKAAVRANTARLRAARLAREASIPVPTKKRAAHK